MLKSDKIETRHKRTPLEEVIPLSTPFILFIDPCGRCNFSCNFCPCNTSDYNKEERHKIMSLSDFKHVIDGLKSFPEKIKVIYLYGFGEPLLNPDFIEMAKYLKAADVCREIRLVTNGYLMNPKLNDQLVESGIDLIRISIEALNDKDYKKICGVNLRYEDFVANIADLYKKSRGKLQVGCKIVNATISSEDDTKLFHEIYDSISDFAWVEDIVGGWPEFEEMVYPEGQQIEADNWIWKSDHYTKCSFSLVMMMVHSNGVVSPCPNDWKIAHDMGNAFENTLPDIWSSEKWKKFQLLHVEEGREKIPFCQHCICSGYDKIDHITDILSSNIRKSM